MGYKDIILHFDTQQALKKLKLAEVTQRSVPLKIICNLKDDTSTLIGQDCAKISKNKDAKTIEDTTHEDYQHIQALNAKKYQKIQELKDQHRSALQTKWKVSRY
jgi:hypothetical protein